MRRCDRMWVAMCLQDIDRKKTWCVAFYDKILVIGYIIEYILMLLTKKKDSKGGHGMVKMF